MITRMLGFFMGSVCLPSLTRSELEALQAKRFRWTMRHAYETVPYYHDLMRRAGKTPGDFPRPESMRGFPVLTKEGLAANQAALVSKDADPWRVRRGSGTSGRQGWVMHDGGFRDLEIALLGRNFVRMGGRPWDRFVSIWPPRRYWKRKYSGTDGWEPTTWSEGMGLMARAGRVTRRAVFLPAHADDPRGDMERVRGLKPDFVLGRPSHFVRMAEAAPGGGEALRLKGVECKHEPVTGAAVRTIEDAFGAGVYRSYGSTELGTMGGDCAFRSGLHLNEDWVYFEVLKDGEQVGPGEEGEVVGTAFGNAAMPLIRYASGDTARMAEGGPCDCAAPTARLSKMLGRREDWVKTAGGASVSPDEVAEFVEGGLGLRDYRIIQRGTGDFLVETPEPESDAKRVAERLRCYLTELVGTEARVAFGERDPDTLWRKNRPVIGSAA